MSSAAYRTLELSPGASQAEIKAAYRRLALKYHPDRCTESPSAAAHFRELVVAYKALLLVPEEGEKETPILPTDLRPIHPKVAVGKLDLGLLGMFLGLAVAGASAVLWHAIHRRKIQTRHAVQAR